MDNQKNNNKCNNSCCNNNINKCPIIFQLPNNDKKRKKSETNQNDEKIIKKIKNS
tara:strand:+ start:815 stop:979 length:165 start_codon:yes stop_codon:yes gene_type:complete